MLAAVVGIDDAVRPGGDATLEFFADGKSLVVQGPAGKLTGPIRLRGADDPMPIRMDLTDAKSLTVRVGFGPDGLDVSDHVDLANARLIKKPSK